MFLRKAEILNKMTDYPVDIEDLMRHIPRPEIIRAGNRIRLFIREARSIVWRSDEEDENGVPLLREGAEWLLPDSIPEEAFADGVVEATFETETERRKYCYQVKEPAPEILRIRVTRRANPDISYWIHYDTETFQYVHGNRSASYYLSDGLLIMNS